MGRLTMYIFWISTHFLTKWHNRWIQRQDFIISASFCYNLFCVTGYRVNEVGVDINKALTHSHTANLLQFVCGLGPRKAQFIIRTLKTNKRLENRSQLVHICQMGPKVFMNSAGEKGNADRMQRYFLCSFAVLAVPTARIFECLESS